jgi:hypothetical protein
MARGPAQSLQHTHSAGPGSSSGVSNMVAPAQRPHAEGMQQQAANRQQPLPPPPGPPPQQQHPGAPVAKMKPNAERRFYCVKKSAFVQKTLEMLPCVTPWPDRRRMCSCFHNHRATKSVGKGFETAAGGAPQDAGCSAAQKYLMNGTMPRMQDFNEYQ